MFAGLSMQERRGVLSKNYGGFIPGYTGYCPTLKFHYGHGYGVDTKDILKDLRTTHIFHGVQKNYQDYNTPVLVPVMTTKGQFQGYVDLDHQAPTKYITGYTGFIPTINSRFGKSYNRAADDCEYDTNEHRVQMAQEEIDNAFLKSIRIQDEALNKYVESRQYQDHKVSPQYPPTIGYTGHMPGVRANGE